jgi:hypothetical protein
MDLLMLTITGGAERTEDKYMKLLAAADFRFASIVPTSTHQCVVEAVPAQ